MNQAATIREEEALIAEDFALFDTWRDRIEYVLDLGCQLPPLPHSSPLTKSALDASGLV